MFVKALNLKRWGFFYRVKNMGTWDPKGFYRKNAELVAIPDICGYRGNGRAVFIECKYVEKVEAKKKLTFKAKISDEQKKFLLEAHRGGCLAGVAFTLADALAIASDDPVRYPRHPRTWCFLPEAEHEAKAEQYRKDRAAYVETNKDPLAFIHLRDKGPDEDDCS